MFIHKTTIPLRENFTTMLIRFVINNVLSYGVQKEFHMLPNLRLGTLKNHIYNFNNFGVLKLTAIYGANGAGKSNLALGLSMLRYLITKEGVPSKLKNGQFKFQAKSNDSQLLAIQFLQEGTVFYYGIEIKNGTIATEELYETNISDNTDILIYERKTNKKEETTIKFSESFEKDEKNQIIKEVLLQEFIKPNKPILKWLADRKSSDLEIVKKAYAWFDEVLTVITPESKPAGLAYHIDTDPDFKTFASNMMCSFNIGVTGLSIQKEKIENFFGKDNEERIEQLKDKVEESPEKRLFIKGNNADDFFLIKENNQVFVKKLQVLHKGAQDIIKPFDKGEESDGTIRLLDFIPAFKDLVYKRKVYIIDEIERSLHPLLIKELLKKFSTDLDTKGQLIFTTHESNLLDQDIFRQDEIWFAEKDNTGSTDLYSLNAFKEHKTIDIQKGYLSGRYGSIPFLGNLQDLNWHSNVTQK